MLSVKSFIEHLQTFPSDSSVYAYEEDMLIKLVVVAHDEDMRALRRQTGDGWIVEPKIVPLERE